MLEKGPATAARSTFDLCYATATELARRIRVREISSAEVTEAFLARIAAHNIKLNAIVHLFDRDARSRAKEADEALARGQSWGALHGVPVTIKESFLIANTPSTLNSRRMKDSIAAEDAVAVKRIKSAGAIILGKTNVPAELRGYQVKGDIYPEGRNPHRLECSPGGSTGGGAAAIAAGMTALELGADSGGSLRVPAHFCGVFCLKPTDKTIPRTGMVPLPKAARGWLVNMAQPGPLGRSIDDLELLWEIIRGPDPSDFEIARIAGVHRRAVRSNSCGSHGPMGSRITSRALIRASCSLHWPLGSSVRVLVWRRRCLHSTAAPARCSSNCLVHSSDRTCLGWCARFSQCSLRVDWARGSRT